MAIFERIKTVAKEKAAEAGERISKEKQYQAYKHPTLSYLKSGQSTTDYRHAEEFGERQKAEKAKAAVKATKRAETRAAIKSTIKTTAKTKIREMKAEAKKRPKAKKNNDLLGFGGGPAPGTMKDPLGFKPGAGFDLGIGPKKGKKRKEFTLW